MQHVATTNLMKCINKQKLKLQHFTHMIQVIQQIEYKRKYYIYIYIYNSKS